MRNTQLIQWHENCLYNLKIHLLNKKEELERLRQEVEKLHNEVDFYDDQIRSAKITGKLKFDKEKYKIKRKPLTSASPTSKEGMELSLNHIQTLTPLIGVI